MLTPQTEAPLFTLFDHEGNPHSLDAYRGSWVLLYFYPKDDTPGCTKEACALRDTALEYERKDIVILGVSKDNADSHAAFIEKYRLPFTLLSDPEGIVIGKYGAKGPLGTKRISYLINPEGMIEKAYAKVSPEHHAAEVLADVSSLQ